MADTNFIDRLVTGATAVARQAYDRVSGKSEGRIAPSVTGDWHNSASGMTEARVLTGQSKAGFHHAVEVRTAGTQATPAGWSPAVATHKEAWEAAVRVSDRVLGMPQQDNSPRASAVRDAEFKQSFPEMANRPSQGQRDAARQTAPAAQASVAQSQVVRQQFGQTPSRPSL